MGAGVGGGGSDGLVGAGLLSGVMKMFWDQVVVMVVQPCECTKTTALRTKSVSFLVHEL